MAERKGRGGRRITVPPTGQAAEGRIAGQGDAGFHAPILGADRLPPDVLNRLREQARRMGLDPLLVQR